jgi:hypothetical protein
MPKADRGVDVGCSEKQQTRKAADARRPPEFYD